MSLRIDSALDETDPLEAKGLAELDRITYPVRKFLKTLDVKYSFQDPPHSPRSATLVVRDYPLPDDRDHLVASVRSFLVDHGFQPHGELHVKVIDRVTLIVSFPYVDTNDGHKNRPAIRIAYQLSP